MCFLPTLTHGHFKILSSRSNAALRQLLPVIGINDLSAISGQQSGHDAAFGIACQCMNRAVTQRDVGHDMKSVKTIRIPFIDLLLGHRSKFSRCPRALGEEIKTRIRFGELYLSALPIVHRRFGSLLEQQNGRAKPIPNRG